MAVTSEGTIVQTVRSDPTVVGGALPSGSISLVIFGMAPAGGSAKHANHGQVAAARSPLRIDLGIKPGSNA